MLENPDRHRHQRAFCPEAPFPSVDHSAPLGMLARCPEYAPTPLLEVRPGGKGPRFFVKDERTRMGLGSFKALGAAFVIAEMAGERSLEGVTFVTASAGNHGLSVAAGARVFGAGAVIYLAETVPEDFAERLRGMGAEVRREGADYEGSMTAAKGAAEANGWVLLSDTSWPGYTEVPHKIMQGYLVMAHEAAGQMSAPPTHVFLQAAVGGMAAAAAACFREVWGDGPLIYVVEPEAAPALHDAIAAGKVVTVDGPASSMGRLDCKEASLIGLNGLARDADGFILISDEAVDSMLPEMESMGLATTPSGGAGLAAALAGTVDLPEDARVLAVLSEAP